MRVFAIADLHLSFERPKPMDPFGEEWIDHVRRTEANWRRDVAADDLVLVCGDVSWAMRLPEAAPDLAFVDGLPGRKALVRGNHDYWWSSRKKMVEAFPALTFLQANAERFGEVVVCGTRLWNHPRIAWGSVAASVPEARRERIEQLMGNRIERWTPEDERIWRREVERLKLALDAAGRLRDERPASALVCVLHYPPVGAAPAPNRITSLLTEAGVDACVFGHVHNIDRGALPEFDTVLDGVRYVLVSGDFVDFTPVRIL